MKTDYLNSVEKQFLYYQSLGEKAMEQLEESQLFWQPNEDSNSIAVIVKHLHGNMLSRWTDLLTTDGEKPWRDRDSEFENEPQNREDVMQQWRTGWDCLLQALNQLTEDDLEKIIYIRNQGHTVMEAINRQLAHYPYHVGQIVCIAKMIKTTPWISLSIPKNQSKAYNSEKFAQEKQRKHFTDEWTGKTE